MSLLPMHSQSQGSSHFGGEFAATGIHSQYADRVREKEFSQPMVSSKFTSRGSTMSRGSTTSLGSFARCSSASAGSLSWRSSTSSLELERYCYSEDEQTAGPSQDFLDAPKCELEARNCQAQAHVGFRLERAYTGGEHLHQVFPNPSAPQSLCARGSLCSQAPTGISDIEIFALQLDMHARQLCAAASALRSCAKGLPGLECSEGYPATPQHSCFGPPPGLERDDKPSAVSLHSRVMPPPGLEHVDRYSSALSMTGVDVPPRSKRAEGLLATVSSPCKPPLPAGPVVSREPTAPSTPQTCAESLSSRTTVMLGGLPFEYSRCDVLEMLRTHGFGAFLNFLYVPMDFRRKRHCGYALVNMVSYGEAEHLQAYFRGFTRWTLTSQQVCNPTWAEPLQGLQAHIERYRNSPVMHKDVPDEFKPAMFVAGKQCLFPAPTKPVKPTLCRQASQL